METPGIFDVQLAAVWPSPSWSLASKTHAPESVLHLAVAQLGGVVGGAVQSESLVQLGVVASPPPSVPLIVGVLLVPPQAPALSDARSTETLAIDHPQRVSTM
jgi:hypothetical protein